MCPSGLVLSFLHVHQQADPAGLRDLQHQPSRGLRGPGRVPTGRTGAPTDPAGEGGHQAVPAGETVTPDSHHYASFSFMNGRRQTRAAERRSDQNDSWEKHKKWFQTAAEVDLFRLARADSLLFCLCFSEGEREKRGAEECWASKQLTAV